MTREKLIELSKQYFESNKDLQQIIACSDGNFFYSDADASYHLAKNKLEKYLIKREDLNPKKVEPVKTEPKKVEVKKVELKAVKKKVTKNDK